MKLPLLFAATALAVLAGAPASTQDSGSSAGDHILPPSGNFGPSENPAFRARELGPAFRCFDGNDIAGVNRNGDTLYVQSHYGRRREPGRIFSMKLAESCDGLDAAKSITMRSSQGGICEGSAAWVQIDASAKTCKVKNVRVLNRAEVAELAASARR